MHVMFAEPFDNNKTNRCLEKIYNDCKEHVNKKDVMGVMLPVLDDGYHAFYLLSSHVAAFSALRFRPEIIL